MDDNSVQNVHNDLYNPHAIIAIRQDYPKLHAGEMTDYTFTNPPTMDHNESPKAKG